MSGTLLEVRSQNRRQGLGRRRPHHRFAMGIAGRSLFDARGKMPMPSPRSIVVPLISTLTALTLTRPARAEQTVQMAVDALLDGRPVSTLAGGVIVPFTVGIDKDDGYMT